MVQIDPISIEQPKSKDVWWPKKIKFPHDWQRIAFGHHKFSDKKHFFTNHGATKFFWSSQTLQPKIFSCQTYDNRKTLNCHTINNGMLLVTKFVMTKNIMSPIMWWSKKFDHQAYGNWISFYHHGLHDHWNLFVITSFMMTKIGPILITHKPTLGSIGVPLT